MLHENIDPTEDSIRTYRLPNHALGEVEPLGKPQLIDRQGPLVI
ncbi:CRISPR-associated endonuclease Cas2 [Micromonospora peucetia]